LTGGGEPRSGWILPRSQSAGRGGAGVARDAGRGARRAARTGRFLGGQSGARSFRALPSPRAAQRPSPSARAAGPGPCGSPSSPAWSAGACPPTAWRLFWGGPTGERRWGERVGPRLPVRRRRAASVGKDEGVHTIGARVGRGGGRGRGGSERDKELSGGAKKPSKPTFHSLAPPNLHSAPSHSHPPHIYTHGRDVARARRRLARLVTGDVHNPTSPRVTA
jgi:hypothetical protein